MNLLKATLSRVWRYLNGFLNVFKQFNEKPGREREARDVEKTYMFLQNDVKSSPRTIVLNTMG